MNEVLIKEVKQIELEMFLKFDEICRKNDIKYFLGGGTFLGAVRHKGFIPWDDDIDVAMERKEYERFCRIAIKELPADMFLQNYHTEPNCGLVFAKIRKENTIMSEVYSHHIDMHQGIWIDIFPLDHIPDDSKKAIRMKKKALILKNLYIIKSGYHNPHPESWIYRTAYAICKCIVKPISLEFLIHSLESVIRQYENEETNYLFPFGGAYPKKDTTPSSLLDEFSEYEFENHSVISLKDYDAYLTQLYGDYMKLPPVEKRVGGMHNLYEVKTSIK